MLPFIVFDFLLLTEEIIIIIEEGDVGGGTYTYFFGPQPGI